MTWVLVFGGIALGGLVMLICFGIWLWRKAVALLGEVGVLMERAEELAGLLEQIELPSDVVGVPDLHSPGGDGGLGSHAADNDLSRGPAT